MKPKLLKEAFLLIDLNILLSVSKKDKLYLFIEKYQSSFKNLWNM